MGVQAMSDAAVRVKARNRKCLDTLQAFLDELPALIPAASGAEGPKRIAILYGAYHIASLSNNLADMGLVRTGAKDRFVAWTVNAPSAISDEVVPGAELGKDPAELATYAGTLFSSNEGGPTGFVGSGTPILGVRGIGLVGLGEAKCRCCGLYCTVGLERCRHRQCRGPPDNLSGLRCGYLVFYVQRYGVQWERKLFEDALAGKDTSTMGG